jgi:hypothetical protein
MRRELRDVVRTRVKLHGRSIQTKCCRFRLFPDYYGCGRGIVPTTDVRDRIRERLSHPIRRNWCGAMQQSDEERERRELSRCSCMLHSHLCSFTRALHNTLPPMARARMATERMATCTETGAQVVQRKLKCRHANKCVHRDSDAAARSAYL